MTTNVIIPAAGQSTRFCTSKPKWMLTHPDGSLMINKSIQNLDLNDVDKVYVTVLQEHLNKFNFEEPLKQSFSDIGVECNLVKLDEPTVSQPETVYQTIEKEKIEGSIFIKDCDSSFSHKVSSGDYVTVCDANTVPDIRQLGAKSFVSYDENLVLSNIVEKNIVSPFFCTGGYGFSDARSFSKSFLLSRHTSKTEQSLYISDVIYYMMLVENKNFQASHVNDYYDWGTIEEWNRYKRKYATLFVDIDGVIFKNSGKYSVPRWTGNRLENNISCLKKLSDTGKVTIIFTTSRDLSHQKQTEEALESTGIKYDRVIYGLPHAQRIVINDYADTNPYRSCSSINIKRDEDELTKLLNYYVN